MHSEAQVAQGWKAEGAIPGTVRAELEAKLQAGALELPLLPGVAMEITSAAARDDLDTRALAEMLKRDAALSAHVLRIVNSPVYSPRAQIVSLQQAVARVGAVKIREIALVIACRTGVFKAKGFEREIDDVFRHSVATALFAQEIARHTRNNVEDAFLCGLLHDVGRPVLLQALVTLLRDARVTADREAVLELVRELHEAAGAALARAWKLPETVATALAKHHSSSPELEAVPVRIVSLADRFAHLAFDADTLTIEKMTGHPALSALEIYPDVLEKIVKRANVVRDTTGALS
ncbi:MAG TPA: HDOD domain-containing protein [Polyangiaceae bacterium]|jgi:putative nucleotidyltransferase with HDIG domain|nr:HDOD domain-containing protein [Polyangiaceae bacterium]